METTIGSMFLALNAIIDSNSLSEITVTSPVRKPMVGKHGVLKSSVTERPLGFRKMNGLLTRSETCVNVCWTCSKTCMNIFIVCSVSLFRCIRVLGRESVM